MAFGQTSGTLKIILSFFSASYTLHKTTFWSCFSTIAHCSNWIHFLHATIPIRFSAPEGEHIDPWKWLIVAPLHLIWYNQLKEVYSASRWRSCNRFWGENDKGSSKSCSRVSLIIIHLRKCLRVWFNCIYELFTRCGTFRLILSLAPLPCNLERCSCPPGSIVLCALGLFAFVWGAPEVH